MEREEGVRSGGAARRRGWGAYGEKGGGWRWRVEAGGSEVEEEGRRVGGTSVVLGG